MKATHKFKIPAFGLSDGTHDFSFENLENIFGLFGSQMSGSLKADVKADKSTLLITLQVRVFGIVNLICDRTAKPFEYGIDVSERFIYNFGAENKELSENILEIRSDTDFLDLSQFFYDLVMVSVPMKKIHPDHINDYLEERPDGYLVYSDDVLQAGSASADDQEPPIDPRWAALQKLKKQ